MSCPKSQGGDRLSWVCNSHLPATGSFLPLPREAAHEAGKVHFPQQAREKDPRPEENTFQVQVSSRHHFLTSALQRVLARLFGRAQSSRPDNLLSKKAAPIQGLTISCRGFSRDLTLRACLLVREILHVHSGPHFSRIQGEPPTSNPTAN